MAERASALFAKARKAFVDRGIETAALDARLLLLHAAGMTHEAFVAEPLLVLAPHQVQLFDSYIARRLKREPVSKIIGVREFYGRPFSVSRDVLDPRPDTESVIALCLRNLPDKDILFADLGSGSGAIVVTLLAERPLWRAVAIDVSPQARLMTKQNADALKVAGRLSIVDGPWFAQCTDRFDLVVSNPPYISSDDISQLDDDVRLHDPHLALDGGVDGLACYRAIARGASGCLKEDAIVVLEIGEGQEPSVCGIFARAGFIMFDQQLDLAGRVRALAFKRS
jgi:release factor glutamine methyltransferase